MKDRTRRELGAMRRVKLHGDEHPLEPANPAAQAEYTAVATAISEAESQDQNFESGKGTVSGAVDQRHVAVDELLDLMRSLSKAAKVLDAATYPDVATKMRMGTLSNLQELITRAHVFHTTLEPIAAVFIALGASATVAADLQAKTAAVESMRTLKLTGRDQQIGGTAGVAVTVRAGLKRVRKLDAILSQIYRTNPVALAQWKAACRVERVPVTETAPTPAAPPEGGGSGI